MTQRLNGLVAATYTPLHDDGNVNKAAVGPLVEHLLGNGINGLYVCGSTGEGMSLSSDERKMVAEAYVQSAAGRVPVIVQVGHNSLAEARQLAGHAQEIGADMISATCPSYFKVGDVPGLVDCMAEVAGGAPDLPFYYYHIPALTGSAIDPLEFLKRAGDRIPNLAGLKYTDTQLHEFQACLDLDDGRFDVVWGCDEMLLGALATGARGAIGSTYNIAAPLYRRIIAAFADGDLADARRLQSLSVSMIRTLNHFPFHPAMKAVLGLQRFSVGGCRLPQGRLSEEDVTTLRAKLDAIGFFDWSQSEAPEPATCRGDNWAMTAIASDQTLSQRFHEDGYVALPQFVSGHEMAELIANVDRFINQIVPGLPAEHVFYEDKNDSATLKQIQQLGEHDAWFHDLATNSRFREVAERLLAGPVVPKNMQYFNKPPGIGKPTPPHQDGYYFMLDPCEAVTMWFALEDVDEENGCVRYVKGSHKHGMREHTRTQTLGFSQGIVDYPTDADRESEVAFPAQPGDLLVHHALTIHRADALRIAEELAGQRAKAVRGGIGCCRRRRLSRRHRL